MGDRLATIDMGRKDWDCCASPRNRRHPPPPISLQVETSR